VKSLPVSEGTPFFFQFMHNAFLGKVRLYQGKIIFRLKFTKKTILKNPILQLG